MALAYNVANACLLLDQLPARNHGVAGGDVAQQYCQILCGTHARGSCRLARALRGLFQRLRIHACAGGVLFGGGQLSLQRLQRLRRALQQLVLRLQLSAQTL
ncbi:MAG: hypothetical protein EOO61_04755 [Hymenobacter sp.]|nr:MAG: hypothetical protein EOO61_04755 [Hymenobacter sp.]